MSAPKLTAAQRRVLVRAKDSRLTMAFVNGTNALAGLHALVSRGALALDLHITPAGLAALGSK